jgi:RimJ/RimL family protein N-acetyltransferase
MNPRESASNREPLRGEHVLLRARHPDDVAILQLELYDDVATRAQADSRPWRPIPPGARSRYDVPDTDDTAFFSVAAVEDGELVGEALLWDIDQHNRCARVGLALRPSFRRRGWSSEVLELLCEYGFTVRGLNRLQLETAATNTAMLRAATRAGFNQEGLPRQSSWILGRFVDNVVMAILAKDWRDSG